MTVPYALVCLALAGLLLFYLLGRVVENKSRVFRFLFPNNEKPMPPWDWTDAAVIGLCFFFLPPFLFTLARSMPETLFFGPASVRVDHLPPGLSVVNRASEGTSGAETRQNLRIEYADPLQAEELADEHPLTRLLVILSGSDRFLPILVLCFLAGVVAAPIVEEFVFRVVFQGALLAFLFRPKGDFSGSQLTKKGESARVLVTILLPALLFAVIHWRGSGRLETLGDLDALVIGIAVTPVALALTGVAAFIWLRKVRQATWRQLGLVRDGWGVDFLRGIGVFLLFLPIMLLLGTALPVFFPEGAVVDPIPIFVLALLLGVLYWRTGRLAAVVGAHMALNAFSFVGILIHIALKNG